MSEQNEALLDPTVQRVLYIYAKRIAAMEKAVEHLWQATEGDPQFDGYQLSKDAYDALMELGRVTWPDPEEAG
jgi:hypothetical protein